MRLLAWIGLALIAMFAFYRAVAARAERAEAEIATLKQAMTALSANVVRAGSALPARVVVQVPDTSAAEGPSRARPLGGPSAARSSGEDHLPPANARQISYGDQMAYYHASLQAEPVDTSWSRASAQRLRGIFDQVASSATSLQSIECRQTICRAELVHATEAESHTFMAAWMDSRASLEWQGPLTGGVVGTDRDGSARSVFFFAREGTKLPEIQNAGL